MSNKKNNKPAAKPAKQPSFKVEQKTNGKKQKSKLPFIICLVVVAIIAVAAVIVVDKYVEYISDSDVHTVSIINKYIAKNSLESDNPCDAYFAADTCGFDLNNMQMDSADREIVWDSESKAYVLMQGGSVYYAPTGDKVSLKMLMQRDAYFSNSCSDKSLLWKYVNEAPASSEYSIYLVNSYIIEPEEVQADGSIKAAVTHEQHTYKVTEKDGKLVYQCTGCDLNYTVGK